MKKTVKTAVLSFVCVLLLSCFSVAIAQEDYSVEQVKGFTVCHTGGDLSSAA